MPHPWQTDSAAYRQSNTIDEQDGHAVQEVNASRKRAPHQNRHRNTKKGHLVSPK
jgi:hypothetical protein